MLLVRLSLSDVKHDSLNRMGNLLLVVWFFFFSRVAYICPWAILIVVELRFVRRVVILLNGSSLKDDLINVVLNLRGEKVSKPQI